MSTTILLALLAGAQVGLAIAEAGCEWVPELSRCTAQTDLTDDSAASSLVADSGACLGNTAPGLQGCAEDLPQCQAVTVANLPVGVCIPILAVVGALSLDQAESLFEIENCAGISTPECDEVRANYYGLLGCSECIDEANAAAALEAVCDAALTEAECDAASAASHGPAPAVAVLTATIEPDYGDGDDRDINLDIDIDVDPVVDGADAPAVLESGGYEYSYGPDSADYYYSIGSYTADEPEEVAYDAFAFGYEPSPVYYDAYGPASFYVDAPIAAYDYSAYGPVGAFDYFAYGPVEAPFGAYDYFSYGEPVEAPFPVDYSYLYLGEFPVEGPAIAPLELGDIDVTFALGEPTPDSPAPTDDLTSNDVRDLLEPVLVDAEAGADAPVTVLLEPFAAAGPNGVAMASVMSILLAAVYILM